MLRFSGWAPIQLYLSRAHMSRRWISVVMFGATIAPLATGETASDQANATVSASVVLSLWVKQVPTGQGVIDDNEVIVPQGSRFQFYFVPNAQGSSSCKDTSSPLLIEGETKLRLASDICGNGRWVLILP